VPVFEEYFSVSVESLFSQIGGTCGLWLGVGMFGIFHALLFPIKVVMKWLQQTVRNRRKASASPEVELPAHGQ